MLVIDLKSAGDLTGTIKTITRLVQNICHPALVSDDRKAKVTQSIVQKDKL